jgi:hypothetical protein
MSRQSRRRRGRARNEARLAKIAEMTGQKAPRARRAPDHAMSLPHASRDTPCKADEERYVSLGSVPYATPEGRKTRLYGALSGRFWLGRPGRSALNVETRAMQHPITLEEQERVLAEHTSGIATSIANRVRREHGLEMAPQVEARLQLLVIWHGSNVRSSSPRRATLSWSCSASRMPCRSMTRLAARRSSVRSAS